jgi:ElaB/YqjD/DUF883 family membrane-anchored ribosome-binding protein
MYLKSNWKRSLLAVLAGTLASSAVLFAMDTYIFNEHKSWLSVGIEAFVGTLCAFLLVMYMNYKKITKKN